jgi:threonine synthase
MRYISTRGGSHPVDFTSALFRGLAPDGGLYVPEALRARRPEQLTELEIARYFIGDSIPREALAQLLDEALNFAIPLRHLDERLSVLELFHGPTFAFKDVGARVMARLMARLHTAGDPLTVLVATSGDTGSAVAQAFYGVGGTRVVVLFPEGQVTAVQEAQFTTLGGNVTAVAVSGSFDECQRLVKEAFADDALRERAQLTSANSINIARLIPQSFYYARAASGLAGAGRPRGGSATPVFSVPSGNFGNLTAGLFAWRLGAPIGQFVAATTVNDTLPRYLATGHYEPRPSISTLANAMDVGHPSNVERMRWLFGDDVAVMRATITASVHTDDEVRAGIRQLWQRYGYVADPHTAIAYLGSKRVNADAPVVFLATAHPAKFREVVEPTIEQRVPLPPALADALTKPRLIKRIAPRLAELRPLLA